MLAVPAPLSLLLLAFSLVANDPSLLSCPISIIERLQRLSFQGVVSDMAFSHSRPVDCILPEQTQRPIVPITTHFSNCLSYLLLLSSSPCHFSLQNVSSALSLFEVKNHTALLRVFFSWREHPPPIDKCFSKTLSWRSLKKMGTIFRVFE